MRLTDSDRALIVVLAVLLAAAILVGTNRVSGETAALLVGVFPAALTLVSRNPTSKKD